jgi:hypothetical protein
VSGTRGWLPRLLAAAALFSCALPARADLDVRDRIGFGGRWVIGAPTPYTLTLGNSGPGPVVVMVRVSTGASFGLHDFQHLRALRLDAGAVRDEVFLIEGPQPWEGAIRVEIEVDPTVVIRTADEVTDRGTMSIQRPQGMYSEATGLEFPTHVVGVVGDPRSFISSSIARAGLGSVSAERQFASSRMAAADVPDTLLKFAPLALEGLETLVLCDPDARTCAEPAALDGVLDWVALGGTLVVSLADHAAEFAASPLAAHLPARWTGAQRRPVAEIHTELETGENAGEEAGPWTELRAATPDAATSGSGARGPHRIERRIGMGRVVVLAYDARGLLWTGGNRTEEEQQQKLARVLAIEVPAASKERDWNATTFSGLPQSISTALQSGAFAPPPLALVIFGIVVYVVVVGPLDWFVLKRLRKERLTTLTFLGAVLAFTALAFGASVLLFSSGERVNRIVVADLADGGRDGRQLLRTVDIAGFYAPRGADQPLAYSDPSALLNGSFPGLGFGGDVGSSLPVMIAPGDPLRPDAVVQLPFRSQRVVRAHSVGTLGPTIEVEWKRDGPRPAVRVTNGLPVDLDEVFVYVDRDHAYALGPVASGTQSGGGEFDDVLTKRTRPPLWEEWGGNAFWTGKREVSPEHMRRMLEAVTIGSFTREGQVVSPANDDEAAVLRKLGLARAAGLGNDRALVVAFASAAPVVLPGSSVEGDAHVVIRKEVPLR